MESFGHFIFQLFKIAIISAVYTTILLLLYKLIRKNSYNKLQKESVKKLKLRVFLSIYALLFVYMFTYWGNHGLGDSAKIPVGNFTTMENINWDKYAKLDDRTYSNGDPIETSVFTVAGNKILGSCDSNFYSPEHEYFIYDLDTRNLIEFPTAALFNEYTREHKLPGTEALKGFMENYQEYWGGWRFWLLP